MSVEILSVNLSNETIEALAERVAALLDRGNRTTTQSNPPSAQNPQGAGSPEPGQPADPWGNGNVPQQAPQAPQAPVQQYQTAPPYSPQQQPQNGQQDQRGFNCAHGSMRFVPAGKNRNTGESYGAYYACGLDRGVQGRCRNSYV
jgi:hypothetical protein